MTRLKKVAGERKASPQKRWGREVRPVPESPRHSRRGADKEIPLIGGLLDKYREPAYEQQNYLAPLLNDW